MAMDIRREAEELARYYSELVRRLAQNGVSDVEDLLALYERLTRALDAISRQEIGWAAEHVQHMVESLVQMASNIDALRRMKGELDDPSEIPGP
jgi:hypothetical protein